ncbi:acetoacetate decarboxylase [Rhodosalinus sp. K401]|uniref:acetoacetate decarboxylase n=1 Tax=Rhodosalinus sp. K401 TaxID=3239195 RepID=UPI0035235764
MTEDEILDRAGMPPGNPSYPFGPYRFIDRQYFMVIYETDAEAIRAWLPEPLEPDGSGTVVYEWIDMPDSSGFGSYRESGLVIPATLDGVPVNYTAMMFLNDEPPITAGREIWGFPKRWGEPTLDVRADTLTGTLAYSGERVAMGTMAYKPERLACDPEECAARIAKTTVNLKLLPCVTGRTLVAQIVAFEMTDIHVKGIWRGPARLHLVPHVHAPLADLPVRRVVEGQHVIADMTLPYGRVVHDYLA